MADDVVRDDQRPRDFDEAAYLRAFPDVAMAISSGEWRSALQHFLSYGIREDRLADSRYRRALAGEATLPADLVTAAVSTAHGEPAEFPQANVDAVLLSRSGWCLVIGWIDDTDLALTGVIVSAGNQRHVSEAIARCRREDAEAVVSSRAGKLLGFWSVFKLGPHWPIRQSLSVDLRAGTMTRSVAAKPRLVSDEQMREIALEYFAAAHYFGNKELESFIQLDRGTGAHLVELNFEISSRVVAGAAATRFGPRRARYDGSIIVCLYGKPEFLFLQAALFAVGEEWSRYEFIYVSNSPELAEILHKEAAIAARIYGVSITLVILPDNAGFGAANNVAAEHASSSRIMIVNPDIFPRRADWAATHSQLVQSLPQTQTAMFGAPLYYDDGSLMHAGMFFEIDQGWLIHEGQVERHDVLRVEHYAKGAPPSTAAYLCSKIVPAVTGAFISADRNWFETVGGFSMQYVFGHYEDADLCLKSRRQGKPVWLHPLPLWHLEGKGSTRRQVHEGGSLVNRWLFTTTWGEEIRTSVADPAREHA